MSSATTDLRSVPVDSNLAAPESAENDDKCVLDRRFCRLEIILNSGLVLLLWTCSMSNAQQLQSLPSELGMCKHVPITIALLYAMFKFSTLVYDRANAPR